MLSVWWEQIESGTVLDKFSLNPPVLCHFFHSREVYSFFQVDRNQCFYFQFSSVATSGFFSPLPPQIQQPDDKQKGPCVSSNAPTWKKRYSQSFVPVMSGREWDSIRQAVEAWVVGLVHFPLWVLSLILIFWGLVGFVMRCFFLVSFIFLMLSKWWSSITRWSHFIYINAKNFRAIHQDAKICCTKINIVCES